MIGKLAELDTPTRARIDAACNFLNHKIRQLRVRVLRISGAAVVAAVVFALVSDIPFQVLLTGPLLVSMLAAAHAHREIRRWYKQMVIGRVVEALGNGLTYSHASDLSEDQFRAMAMFPERIDDCRSEDQVSGRRNEVGFSVHETRATREEGSGKNRRTVTVFKGIIAALEFNKNFAGHTVVVPDKSARRLFGEGESIGDKRMVPLANADFENVYTVYSTNDQEAHYLLTPKLLELVLDARTTFHSHIRLAFFQNWLYVAIPGEGDRFEVSLFGPAVTPQRALGDLAAIVTLAEQLIDTLDLETRIWTRI